MLNLKKLEKTFNELGTSERQVLRYILSQGGEIPEKEVVDHLPESPLALANLKALLLLQEIESPQDEGAKLLSLPREYARFVSLTPTEKTTLAHLLSRETPAYHAELAARYSLLAGTKAFQIRQLRKKLLDAEFLRLVVENLPEVDKGLWQAGLEADGTIDKKIAIHPQWEPAVQSLYRQALLFPDRQPLPNCYVIPSDLLAIIRGKTEKRKTFSKSPSTPAALRSWGLRLLTDLQLYAAYQASGRLQFTGNNLPQRHQLRAFLKAMGTEEENYGLFLDAALDAFFAKVIKKTPQAFSDHPTESMSKVIAFWRDGESWQESALWRHKNRGSESQYDKTLKAKRLILLKALESLPVREWVDYPEFMEFVMSLGWKRVDTGFRSNTAFYHSDRYPRERWLMGAKTSREALDAQETLANMVSECLVWLGLVETGQGKSGRTKGALTHLRLTEWGRQFLDQKNGHSEPLPATPTETQFRVLTHAEISVTPHLRPDVLITLFKIAVLRSAYAFALTKESLREALDEGMAVKTILDFLTDHSATEFPPTVQQFVEEIAAKHGHIKLGFAGAYLEVDDAALLVELRANRSLREIFQKQVGDRLAILNGGDLERIAKQLKKLGYLPVVEKSPFTSKGTMKYEW